MKVFKIEFYKDEDQEEKVGNMYYYAKNSKDAYKKAKGDYKHESYDVFEMDEDEVKGWGETIYESTKAGLKSLESLESYSNFLMEAIRNMNDNKTDSFIKDNWEGKAVTFGYNAEAAMEMGKIWPDVIVTKDKEFFHIPSVQSAKQAALSDKVIKKFNLKEVK